MCVCVCVRLEVKLLRRHRKSLVRLPKAAKQQQQKVGHTKRPTSIDGLVSNDKCYNNKNNTTTYFVWLKQQDKARKEKAGGLQRT